MGRRAFGAIVALALLASLMPGAAFAHAASSVACTYDFAGQSLTVVIVHTVSNAATHYISEVNILRNGVAVSWNNYTSQPTTGSFSYVYSVPAADGDVLTAETLCNLGGTLSGQVTVLEPDLISPAVSISSPSEGSAHTSPSITVSGTASDNKLVSKVEVRINSGSWLVASGTTTWSRVMSLVPGLNVIAARATDGQANTNTTTVNVTFNDVTPPAVTITSHADGVEVTGRNITLAGTSSVDAAVSKVEARIGNGTWALASGTTAWSVPLTLAPGVNFVSARAADSSGSEGFFNITIVYNDTAPPDAVPPSILILAPQDGNASSESNIDVSGTASDDVGLSSVAVRVNNGTWGLASGLASWTTSVTLSNGTNRLEARAEDISGNSASDIVLVSYTPPPSPAEYADSPPTVAIGEPVDGATLAAADVTVSGTAEDNETVAKVEVRVNNGTWALAAGTISWQAAVSLAAGGNLIEARATDNASNSATAGIVVYHDAGSVDSVPPTIHISSPADAAALATRTAVVSGTAADNVGLAAVEVRLGSGAWQPATGLSAWSAAIELSPGANNVTARATDLSGNSAIAFIVLFLEVPDTTADGVIGEGEYASQATFGGGDFTVHWTVEGGSIRMGLVAEADGWVSIGFDPGNVMKDADMVFGWVDQDGTPHVLDCYSTGEFGPHPPDADLGGADDLTGSWAAESNGTTVVEFSRPLETSDGWDKPLSANETLDIVWGFSDSDDFDSMHTGAGFGQLNLTSGTGEDTTGNLWVYHAAAMSAGLGLSLATVLVLRKKGAKWWFGAHKALGAAAAASSAIGLAIGLAMVSQHFRVLHSYIGLASLASVAILLGSGFGVKRVKQKKRVRGAHIYLGWAMVAMMAGTVITGLLVSGILD